MSNLPTGTVTFLLTDIEGSTRLWEQHPDTMRQAMSRHDALIEECVQQHNGTIVRPRGEGDSRFAVFANANDAVASAAAIQLSLYQENWPMTDPLQVRIALHTGESDLRMGDYYGSAVNRCARLRGIAYGGQTLLSATTAELVVNDGVYLKDLGIHRLKDLDRAEHTYQLIVQGLPEDFPFLKSLDAFPNNLPLQLTSFIGRERELAEAKELLTRTRLLTLTGSGGAGKTRLALQVAADLLDSFVDGTWLIELATTTDPALVANTLAGILGVRALQKQPLIEVLTDFLRDKQMLILLDNCEHLLLGCGELTMSLLQSCPGLKVLATSREALGIMGEASWRVPSLTVPNPQLSEPIDALNRCEAVQLFLERAKAVRPDFGLTAENARPIAQICQRLDGIPLAIELATTRLRGMSAGQIADRLDDRFRLLTGGSRTALPRQQTLRTMIDWSYGLLSAPERILLHRLSVFVGGWTLEGCEAVCSGEVVDSLDVMDLLMQLVNKSLVVTDERGSETRYQMLETIRHYAREKLLDSGEVEILRNRHLDWFLHVAEELSSDPWNSAKKSVLDHVAAERDNFRSAMEWALENDLQACLRLGGTSISMIDSLEYYSEWQVRIEAALHREEIFNLNQTLASQIHLQVRARALFVIGSLCFGQGDSIAGAIYLAESVMLLREVGDKPYLVSALNILATIYIFSGDIVRGVIAAEEALHLSRAISDSFITHQVLVGLGQAALFSGDIAEARTYFEESLAIGRQHGGRWGTAYPLIWLGTLSLQIGDLTAARLQLEEVLAIYRESWEVGFGGIVLTRLAELEKREGNFEQAALRYKEAVVLWRKAGNRGAVALVLQYQGYMAVAGGDHNSARTLFLQSLALRDELEDAREMAGPLEGLATLAAVQENWSQAARLLGLAEVIRAENGRSLESFDAIEHERVVGVLREQLALSELELWWAEGRAMTVEQAIRCVSDLA